MTAAIFALVAVLLAGVGARDQLLLAALTLRQGQRPSLIAAAVICGILTSALAAWATREIADELNQPAQALFAGFALLAAGAESLFLTPKRDPAEPTYSLFAAALVLLAGQMTDVARFLILAIAAASAMPLEAGVGGAVGSVLALLLGVAAARPLLAARRLVALARRIAGVLLLGGGAAMVAHAFRVY